MQFTRNLIHEEIKGRLKSGNACYHSVQNRLVSQYDIKKDEGIENYNFPCCFVLVWDLVAHDEWGT